jgi:hypothetical protein
LSANNGYHSGSHQICKNEKNSKTKLHFGEISTDQSLKVTTFGEISTGVSAKQTGIGEFSTNIRISYL